MMRTNKPQEERPDPALDRWLWQRCLTSDAPEDEAARFLDLAAFADGLLEADERDRVAAWLADDPQASEDVSAARAVQEPDKPSAELERVIARACALSPEEGPTSGNVIVLRQWRRRRVVQGFAQWGSIAAAVALVGWLGFSMGSDTLLALTAPRQTGEASFLPELFDPAPAFLRDLGEGLPT
jgi:anti-sigma factor RsiW